MMTDDVLNEHKHNLKTFSAVNVYKYRCPMNKAYRVLQGKNSKCFAIVFT